MAEEEQTSPQTAAGDEEEGAENQAPPPIIEIPDGPADHAAEARPGPVQMEDKTFVSSLHSFMKARGTPIDRIPHLGFKQINLWRIYKAVEKLGGYDSVTARRLWKKVYDELGGSPGSTSAATCTRRHYERLVLPFERHARGEEDKPLPPNKPRKLYKRNLDSKVLGAEKKRRRIQSDRKTDSEMPPQRSPEAACQAGAVTRPRPTLWAPDRQSGCSQASGLCAAAYAHLVQTPSSRPWAAAEEVIISPLEKKKRMAQASLKTAPGPQGEDEGRPSVIRRSRSPEPVSSCRNFSSSDGSPVPLSSSSSSCSPSPYSISSEDGAVGDEEEKPRDRSGAEKSGQNGESAGQTSGRNKDVCDVSCPTADPIEVQVRDAGWRPADAGSVRYFPHPSHPSHPSSSSYSWAPSSTSSFIKVTPKPVQPVQPVRPAPIRPCYKAHQGAPVERENSLTCVKKLTNMAQWLHQTERREKSRTTLQKVPATLQGLCRTPESLQGHGKSGRDSRHDPPLHPVFLPGRMRPPQPQLIYRHFPATHPALIGSALYPYPYAVPLLNPLSGYAPPAMSPIYPHKL